jgi:hypothetical protein
MSDRRICERLALWWVGFYTRSAPEPAGSDRRAEVASDIYEHVQTQAAAQMPRWEANRALLSRMLRGVGADAAWRIEVEASPGRVAWHLTHPATILGFAWLVLVPLDLLGDAARGRLQVLYPLSGWMWGAVIIASSGAVVFGLASFSFALWEVRPLVGVGQHQWRVRLFCLASFFWAMSGLWRFAGNSMTNISDFAWTAFGFCLIAYLLLRLADTLHSRMGLDFRKVSS